MAQKITFQERVQLFELLNKNYPISAIAEHLNRHPSTIYREVSRVFGRF